MNKTNINKSLKATYNKVNVKNEAVSNSTNIKLVKSYKQALTDIRLELERLYSKFGNDTPSLAYANRMGQLQSMEKQIKDILIQLHDDSTTVIQGSMNKLYEDNFYTLPKAINSELGVNIAMGVIDEAAVAKSIENPLQRLTRNTNATNDKVREAITRNLINGESYPKLSSDIAEAMNEGAGSAMRIARTELHRMVAEARADSFDDVQESADSVGIKIEKMWIATNDSRTRSEHAAMDGQISENGVFDFFGTPVEEPGSEEMGTDAINCRCSSGVVLV